MEASELEEGEACFYKDDHENIDADIDFSHIDKRIRRVLGPLQKDFEGGVSAENLGAMFGGYGSFLPTYERSPCNCSRPKTPQKNQSTFRSPSNLQTEGASHSQILKGSSNASSSVKRGTVSISAHSSHNKSVPSGDVSAKMTSCLLSTQVADKCSLKDGTSNRSENPSDQKTMKIRIKISDNTAQRNAVHLNQMNAIYYSGLGLEGSPSSLSGDSSEESGGIAPVSREIGEESPTKILEVMTSFPLPEDVLISPLDESLLHLTREEKLFKASKIEHFPVVVQQDSMLVNESVSLQGSGKLIKEKTKLAVKSRPVLKNGKATYLKNGMIAPKKMTSGKEIPRGEEFLPNDLKTPLSNSVTATDAGEILKVIGQDVFREANKGEVKGRLLSSGLLKEESLDSISHQDYDKNKKKKFRSSSVEKDGAQRMTNFCKDDDSKLNKFNGYKISTTSKAYSDASKLKENLELLRQSADEKSIYPEQVRTDVPHKKGKQYFEGKRTSMGMLGNGKPATVSTKESLNVEMGAVRGKRKSASLGVAPSSSKMQKLNSHGRKVRDSNIDLLSGKDLEQKDNRFNQRERPSGEDASLGNVEVGHTNFLDEPREALSGKKNDTRLISAVKDVQIECPPVNANGLNSVTAPGSVELVNDVWAFCDGCKTWRLLPHGMTDKDLPKKWFCRMQNWLPAGMNKCRIAEEETTKMLYALNQMPVPESYTIGNRGKKRLGLKETSNPGSSSSTVPILKPSKNHLNNSSTRLNGGAAKEMRKESNKNRVTSCSSHLSPDLQGAKEVNASSPRRNSSDVTATTILKEAKELKDYADRLKSSGFAVESNEAYFQAALKFLHGAGLLETCSSDSGKHGEMSQLQVYRNAAKLCELCAREYESCQEMAATALAYKCMEVAYMKVVYCKNSYMNRDRRELQATLNLVASQGESPLYSASDVENFNTMERAKGASHAARSHVITARLLEFTEDVNLAMDASKKSQAAFIVANAILEAAQHRDCIAHLKRAIDLSFHDVEEFTHLVWLAMKGTSRTGFGGARD